jgi:hypothetical protein
MPRIKPLQALFIGNAKVGEPAHLGSSRRLKPD